MKGSVLETVAPMISDKTAVSFAAMLSMVHIKATGWLEGPAFETSCKRTARLNDQAWHLSPHGRMLHAFKEKCCLVFPQHTLLVVPVKAEIQTHNEYHKVYTKQTRVPVKHRLDTRRILLVKQA